jgi:hypothetical protein
MTAALDLRTSPRVPRTDNRLSTILDAAAQTLSVKRVTA